MRGIERVGPFDRVLDVGGNLGDFAEECWRLWPGVRVTSFEPIPPVAARQKVRADGRWDVVDVAISDGEGEAVLRVCVNQHSASTMQPPGTVRRERFGIADRFRDITVATKPLDAFHDPADTGRLLVKIDVEGHEGAVIRGASQTLSAASAAIVEVQQDPNVFLNVARPVEVDAMLRDCGLSFAGVLEALAAPTGGVVQFDGLWLRL